MDFRQLAEENLGNIGKSWDSLYINKDELDVTDHQGDYFEHLTQEMYKRNYQPDEGTVIPVRVIKKKPEEPESTVINVRVL